MICNNGMSETSPKRTVCLSCLSTDASPSGDAIKDISGGSSLIEIDTGTVFFLNEATGKWIDPLDDGAERSL